MALHLLDTVVLERGVPEHSLKKGDLGAIVELYDPDGVEVEFVSGSGTTLALLTLNREDVRPVGGSDILSVRELSLA